MQTKDQERARKAYAAVVAVHNDNEENFKTHAMKFPSMVMQCGVLQSLAYCKQKDPSGIFKQMDEWLTPMLPDTAGTSIVEKISADSVTIWQYQMITREAISFGTWLKRASATILAKVKTKD